MTLDNLPQIQIRERAGKKELVRDIEIYTAYDRSMADKTFCVKFYYQMASCETEANGRFVMLTKQGKMDLGEISVFAMNIGKLMW